MKNLKKAYRLFFQTFSIEDSKKKLIEFAKAIGIQVSDKALDPRNAPALRRQKFWQVLDYKAKRELKIEVVKFLKETQQLYVGKELFSGEDIQVIVEIREDSISLKDLEGKVCGSYNILTLPFDFTSLPGEDIEGTEFWEKRFSTATV